MSLFHLVLRACLSANAFNPYRSKIERLILTKSLLSEVDILECVFRALPISCGTNRIAHSDFSYLYDSTNFQRISKIPQYHSSSLNFGLFFTFLLHYLFLGLFPFSFICNSLRLISFSIFAFSNSLSALLFLRCLFLLFSHLFTTLNVVSRLRLYLTTELLNLAFLPLLPLHTN